MVLAIHIHEFGDCSSFDAKSAGGHWNPNNKQHGEWGSESHHKGDIANLFADSSGNSSLKFETDFLNFVITGFCPVILAKSSSQDFRILESLPSKPRPIFKTTFSIFGPIYKLSLIHI